MNEREERVATAFFVIAVALAALVLAFCLGSYDDAKHLPECREDEYLYPEEFTGPGSNVPDDYVCVPVEVIIERGH